MSTASPPGRAAQRTLAAILFTDAVGFSARMQRDEVGTLALLERDFATMRELCAQHEGEVLKTTGDGLLLTFSSAVRAVACALAMQRRLADQGKADNARDPLQHRIGIHLGDVLVNDGDVMGDGVNIAARLQAEAAPGGVCISQTVYDVVKNKLELRVVCLGPRDLKNIAQSIPVYRLLLEAEALEAAESTGPGRAESSGPGRDVPAHKALLRLGRGSWLAIGALVGVAAMFAVGMTLKSRRAATRAAAAKTAQPVTDKPATPARPEQSVAEDREFSQGRETFKQIQDKYLDKYDFSGLVAAMRERQASVKGEKAGQENRRAMTMLKGAENMAMMKTWLDQEIRRFSRRKLMDIRNLDRAGKPGLSFLGWDNGLLLFESGKQEPRRTDWSQLEPEVFGSIIISAIEQSRGASQDVIMGAWAFSRYYRLPDMQQAADALRGTRNQASR